MKKEKYNKGERRSWNEVRNSKLTGQKKNKKIFSGLIRF